MSKFTVHTPDTGPAASRPILSAVREKVGFVPNLYGVFAESPATLEAYSGLSAAFDRNALSSVERQVVLLTVSRENGCGYCMAAHSAIANMSKVPAEVVDSLRSGEPLADAKLEALRVFTQATVRERGSVGRRQFEDFLAAGFTKAQALDVITGVAMKTLSNYVNHIAETPLDPAFRPQAWSVSRDPA